MNYLLFHLSISTNDPATVFDQETPATRAYAVHVPPGMTLCGSPGENREASFFFEKPHGEAFPSCLVLFSLLMFLLLLRFFSARLKKTFAWRCASSSSGHRRRPKGSWLQWVELKDGSKKPGWDVTKVLQVLPRKTKSKYRPWKIHAWKMKLLLGWPLFEEICKFSRGYPSGINMTDKFCFLVAHIFVQEDGQKGRLFGLSQE